MLSDKVNKKVVKNLSKQIDVLIPIIKERELNFKSFVIWFHEYRKIWKPKSNEILEVKMEPTNKMDNLTVAVIKNKNIIGTLPLEKLGAFPKQLFASWNASTMAAKLKL